MPLVAVGLLACLLLAAPAQAGPGESIVPGKTKLMLYLPNGGYVGGGLGVGVHNDGQSPAVSLCWYYTSDQQATPAGYQTDNGRYLVYFPFLDTQPIIDYVHSGGTYNAQPASADGGNQTASPSAGDGNQTALQAGGGSPPTVPTAPTPLPDAAASFIDAYNAAAQGSQMPGAGQAKTNTGTQYGGAGSGCYENLI